MTAYKDVTNSESKAYKSMKTALDFNDESMLKFIKVRAISGYNAKNLIVGVQDL